MQFKIFDRERSMRSKLALLATIAAVFFGGTARAATTNFLAAADFSDLAFFESKGAKYKDGGQIQDAIQILKNHGINCIRLRLWTSSAAQAQRRIAYELHINYTNNLAYTVPLAVRVKNAGLLFSLDFHYSDTWADPGKQATPSIWTNGLNLALLLQLMRTYNSNTIAVFAASNAMPDYVQIGNEITARHVVHQYAGAGDTIGQVSPGSFNTSWIRSWGN